MYRHCRVNTMGQTSISYSLTIYPRVIVRRQIRHIHCQCQQIRSQVQDLSKLNSQRTPSSSPSINDLYIEFVLFGWSIKHRYPPRRGKEQRALSHGSRVLPVEKKQNRPYNYAAPTPIAYWIGWIGFLWLKRVSLRGVQQSGDGGISNTMYVYTFERNLTQLSCGHQPWRSMNVSSRLVSPIYPSHASINRSSNTLYSNCWPINILVDAMKLGFVCALEVVELLLLLRRRRFEQLG